MNIRDSIDKNQNNEKSSNNEDNDNIKEFNFDFSDIPYVQWHDKEVEAYFEEEPKIVEKVVYVDRPRSRSSSKLAPSRISNRSNISKRSSK